MAGLAQLEVAVADGMWTDEATEAWANKIHSEAQKRTQQAQKLVDSGSVFFGSAFPDTRVDGSPMKAPMEDLVDAWRSVFLDAPPFALPEDLSVLPQETYHSFASHADYARAVPLQRRGDKKLHLGLIPVPYAGDLRSASVYILMLNPGFESSDYFVEAQDPRFREALVENLRQERGASEFPFPFLDPAFSYTGGFRYWTDERRLGWVVRALVEQDGIDFREAMSRVSKAVCVLQLVPYHSAGSPLNDKLLASLRSINLVKWYVKSDLAARAQEDKVSLIVTRQVQAWGVRAGENVIAYQGPETRGAYLSQKSHGTNVGRVFARRLGIRLRK